MSPANGKRIAVVVHEYYPRDFRVRRETEALARAGYELTVIALRQPGEPARDTHYDGQIQIHRLPVRRHRGAGLMVYLAEYAAFAAAATALLAGLHARRRVRLVHVHNPPDFLVFASLLPRLTGARVVFDIHDSVPDLYASRFGGRADHPALRGIRWVERLATRYAHRVVTVHEGYRRKYESRGVPAGRITIVANGPDERRFDPARVQPAPLPPSWEHTTVLLHHGTLVERYGVGTLLRAFAKLHAQRPDTRLLVLGEGDFLEPARELARELHLDAVARLPGFVAHDEIPSWIMAADLCVVPNEPDPFTDEIMPTKLLEYIAMGKPAVASRTATVAEYFDDDAVALVPPGDADSLAAALLALIDDPARRSAMATRARAALEPLRWERQAEALVSLYQDLLS